MINFLEKNRLFAILLTVLIAIEIFYFSSISSISTSSGGGSEIQIIPMAYHYIVFFLFSFFLLVSIKGKNKISPKYLILVLVLSIVYAILDEIHQIYVPGRVATIKDIITDTAGILSSMFLYLQVDKRKSS